MTGASFDELCAEREALRNYVLVHAKSLRAFKQENRPWYRRQQSEDKGGGGESKVRHLTTTASCLESLSHVPAYENDDPPPPCPRNAKDVRSELEQVTKEFATAALQLKEHEWKSENQRLVYTRVRTLPVILHLADEDTLRAFDSNLASLVKSVWKLLDIGDVRAQGIAEQPEGRGVSGRKGYPPNAFHTYWAIRLFREYEAKGFLRTLPGVREKEAVAQLWARRTLAAQTALISGGQRNFDAHQLAWALSTDVLCRDSGGEQPATADRQHIELYDAALRAFFSEQKEGRWRLYEPLFHYSRAGNAYCYTYETLAELLRLCLQGDHGRVLRDHLRKYAGNLIEAWHYARDTELKLEGGGLGWCSGHHPHYTQAEPWATASVFSYLQNLRCLIGCWAADEAKRELQVKPSGDTSPEDGERILTERGETWRRDGAQTVGRQLAMLFLHPLKASSAPPGPIDPDRPLVDESRSAVLFGPPGTSKTTLVEGLAAALDWDYVEVHASHFLSEGLNNVPKMADSIFQKLMELDHCVILFDEIDELIRLRDDADSDPFGRFLTTSMLPKIAKLWEQRRVLFFVATNDIAAADPAIKRSQRFDAAVFVPPPSFEKKKKELEDILENTIELTYEEVDAALEGENAEDAALGVFALLRWDQIADLAHRIAVGERREETSSQVLTGALEELGQELERSDWQHSDHAGNEKDSHDGDQAAGTDAGHGGYPHRQMFKRWHQQKLDERRDYRRKAVLRLSSSLFDSRPRGWPSYGPNKHYLEFERRIEEALEIDAEGTAELAVDGWRAIDREGIFYFVSPS
jgi:hypothetical protein